MSSGFLISCETVDLADANGEIRGLADYWEARRLARAMPVRRDLDILDMRAWIGRLSLYEVLGDGDFLIRLRGTLLSAVAVPNHVASGVRVSRTKPSVFAEMGLEQYQAAFAGEQPVVHRIALTHDGHSCPYDRLSLPLAAGAGLPPMLMTFVCCDIPRSRAFWHRFNLENSAG